MKAYQFDPEIAKEYGVDCAVMIWNLSYWIEHNEANGRNFYDGRTWTFNSVEAYTKLFPFWTRAQIRRILKNLEDAGVIVTGNYNQIARDRTIWYAFSDSFLGRDSHLSKSANGFVETEKCNRDIDINKDKSIQIENTDNAADGGLFDSQDEFQTVTVTRPRRTSENLCLFEKSKFYNFNLFAAEFQAEEFKGVDLVYYYHALADWSSQKGKKMRDWIATVRGFMRRDSMAGKLVKVKEPQSSEMDARMAQYLKEMGE